MRLYLNAETSPSLLAPARVNLFATRTMHDGVQTHTDGSPFYGIRIFSSRRTKDRFVRELKRQGYQGDSTSIGD